MQKVLVIITSQSNMHKIQCKKIEPRAQIYVYLTRYFINCTCIGIQCMLKRNQMIFILLTVFQQLWKFTFILSSLECVKFLILKGRFDFLLKLYEKREGNLIKLWYPLIAYIEPPPFFRMFLILWKFLVWTCKLVRLLILSFVI